MEVQKKNKDKYLLSSLNNALKVLDLLSVRGNISLAEISRITGYDKSSAFKMLYTLEHRDYVIKTADARYGLSAKLANYGNRVSDRKNIVDVAVPYMQKLRDACHESVYLGVLNVNGRVIFMHKEDGDSSERVIARVAYELDAYTNAAGKILLANLPPPMQKNIVAGISFWPHTSKTITSADVLLKQLSEICNSPLLEEYEENYPNHADLAAPLFDNTKHCIAALSIVCTTKILRANRAEFRALLLDAAKNISLAMGNIKLPK